jgi:hypothetical protein
MTGPDDFFDLVADRDAAGYRRMVVAGQEAEVPARHCVSAQEGLQAARQVIASQRIQVSEPKWERQTGIPNP